MTAKNCANGPKLVLKDLCEKSFVRNVLYSLHSIMCHKNNFQSPTRTYPIIRLHEHWVIFHVLEWYSTNQIPFCHSRLCFRTCHFFVNNLHFITYSNSTEKFTWNRMGLTVKFPCSSPMFWLNPMACQFLVKNLHFFMYLTHKGQSPKRQQPI